MATVLGYINDDSLTNIAKAIRKKTGSLAEYKLSEMPAAIDSITTGVDTSDANATAENIQSGATAYVNGVKITGTHVEPTVADMTADATATAADLVTGKTAYANGVKLEGTLIPLNYYSGTTEPASTLGEVGEIYFELLS